LSSGNDLLCDGSSFNLCCGSAEASSSSSLSDARESVRQGLSGDDARHMKATQKGAAVRLVNLLCAYALHDPEIGYCQG
jgi:hypothetical protein